MVSRIRQNFKEESEALINKQINMEFYASYVYMSMYAYFDRDDQVVFFNFDIDIYNMRRSWWEDVIMFVTLFCNNRVFRRMFYECKKVFFFNL